MCEALYAARNKQCVARKRVVFSRKSQVHARENGPEVTKEFAWALGTGPMQCPPNVHNNRPMRDHSTLVRVQTAQSAGVARLQTGLRVLPSHAGCAGCER